MLCTMTIKKPILGVAHLGALPHRAGATGGFEQVWETALQDARALVAGGVTGVIVENFGDAPFCKGTADEPVPPDVPAALAVVARAVRRELQVPVGINCLRNDGMAALGAAAVAGASWVRVNVLAGACLTDQGIVEGEAARLAAYRRQLGVEVGLLADLFVKHAVPLGDVDPATAAKDLAARSGADALIVTGARTGESVDVEFLDMVKQAVGTFPVWIGSGLCAENAAELWPRCDGAIVGTAFKLDGNVSHPVDNERVRGLCELLRRLQ
jgi:membrane complex biogenesis BtpA family protein